MFASLEYAVYHKSNSIIQCFGIPESGKSTILKIAIYELYQMLLGVDKIPEITLTHNYMETIHEITRFGKSHKVGDKFVESDRILIVFQDEQTVLQGNESKSYETQLNNLVENFRAAQIFVMLASPNLKKIAVCNTHIEAIAKDIDECVNWALWMVPKRYGNKTIFEAQGSLLLQYTDEIEEFFSSYHQKKMDHIFTLIENRGLQTVKIPDEVLNDAINKVIKEAKKRGLKTKEQIKALTNVMGVGTSNTTKTVAELAGLQYEAMMLAEKEINREKELIRLAKQKVEEEKRISKLVIQVAKELYEKFDFDELKSASRIVTGWIIEHYPDDWQELMKHKKFMWPLAEYWQYLTQVNSSDSKKAKTANLVGSDRELLRSAFVEAVKIRKYNDKLCERISWYFIPQEDEDYESWSQSKQARAMNINPSSLTSYWKNDKNKKARFDIRENTKIWGDAGELYLKYKLEQTWRKLENASLINPDLSLYLFCAAVSRSKELIIGSVKKSQRSKTTSLYDLEILIDDGKNKVSAAAINSKFVYEDGGSHSVLPESNHHNPWIFIIDKKTLNEFFLPVKKGETHFNMNTERYNESITVEAFLLQLVQKC